jgi:CRP/FNR family transcriptional regulator, cyclic AMP receptor protein
MAGPEGAIRALQGSFDFKSAQESSLSSWLAAPRFVITCCKQVRRKAFSPQRGATTVDLDRQDLAISDREKSAILRRHPLFRELKPEICDRLAAYAKTKEVSRGTTLFVKGDPGTCMFAVCRGNVQVATTSDDGKSAVFNQIQEGEIVGEIALLDGQPRTADAVATVDSTLMIIERRDFLPLLHSNPDVTIKLVEMLCSRLRRTTEQVEDLMFLDLRRRLAKALLRLSLEQRNDGTIAISQSELSQIVGMSREMINKQLQVWVREGCVELQRRRVIVLRPDVLDRILAV